MYSKSRKRSRSVSYELIELMYDVYGLHFTHLAWIFQLIIELCQVSGNKLAKYRPQLRRATRILPFGKPQKYHQLFFSGELG
jgi:hypothetical protein